MGFGLVVLGCEGAPVDRLAVTLTLDNLGGEILWCAAESPRPILHLLGEAKVCVRIGLGLGLGIGLGFGFGFGLAWRSQSLRQGQG